MTPQAVPADSIRQALREVFAGAPYQWKDESDPTILLRAWWRALTNWLDLLAGDHPALFKLLIWGLIALLAGIALHAIWLLIRTTRIRPGGAGDSGEAAPVMRRDAAWYAAEAARLAKAGRYSAALQADFLRLALELDARNVLRFHPSRTPREYLADFPREDPRRPEFRRLIDDLYLFAFAGTDCGPGDLADWQARAITGRYAPGA